MIKTFNTYQRATKKTAVYPKKYGLHYTVLGLTSEAGEVSGKLKKIIRDNKNKVGKKEIEEIAFELGDVMWYVSQICNELGISLEGVATLNVEKLARREQEHTLHGSGDKR